MVRNLVYISFVLVAFASCSPSVTSTMSSTEVYSEDLSVHRPKFSELPESKSETEENTKVETVFPEPKNDVTKNVNTVLDSIDRLRTNITYVDGFTVQVYSGTSSDEAKIAKGKVFSTIQDATPVLKYDEPNFKVSVGKYYTRLEAQKTYAQLREKFPTSIIIPERIYIK
jgi:hypothetical protein